ncbi:hypothetical protein [Paenibacillus agricola]|uniref:Uroporphyrinogen decarboxylase (URO-D) domain-containing protein n=1 Tax=Paenibacillus agricola TaxID=2716264 RepID=A0ABX0JCS9_9BACL|nr:hypothetical protein [Paenibacillus agricola]NHN32682.1 hypothetical protein [Paenibacillus agricola]
MSKKIIGIQLSNLSMLHEGPESCLRFLKDTANINAAFIYATTYQIYRWDRHTDGSQGLAPDHPIPSPDFDYGDIGNTFFKPNPKYFTGTPIFMEESATKRYGDRDLLAEAIEAGDKLGIDIYGRCLEPAPAGLVPGWHAVMSEDCFGRPDPHPCWNNPYYQQWWMSITENLMKDYAGLAGFKYGAERSGPLSTTILRGQLPLCFCRFCREKGEELRIDSNKAREGYIKLYEYVHGIKEGTSNIRDGAMIGVIRLFLEYPEILAWERMQIQAEEHINELIYGNIHSIKPSAKFGIHVYHWQSWDPFYRANINYEKMANYTDFIKPVVYHDVSGMRLKKDIQFWNETWMRELGPQQTLDMVYAMMQYNDAELPEWNTLAEVGFNEKYVYNEVKRCVDAVKGKSLVLAGIGFDVPSTHAVTSKSPEEISEGVYQSVCASFDAGADGILISRESDEMRKVNLQAAGKAIEKYL